MSDTRCRACGAPYLNDDPGSRDGCPCKGWRHRDFDALGEQEPFSEPPMETTFSFREPDPYLGVPQEQGGVRTYPPMESEMVELRRLLHDVLELSSRIAGRFGPRASGLAALRRRNGCNDFANAGTCALAVCLPRMSFRRRRCKPRPVLKCRKVAMVAQTLVAFWGPQSDPRLRAVCLFSVREGGAKRAPIFPISVSLPCLRPSATLSSHRSVLVRIQAYDSVVRWSQTIFASPQKICFPPHPFAPHLIPFHPGPLSSSLPVVQSSFFKDRTSCLSGSL